MHHTSTRMTYLRVENLCIKCFDNLRRSSIFGGFDRAALIGKAGRHQDLHGRYHVINDECPVLPPVLVLLERLGIQVL